MSHDHHADNLDYAGRRLLQQPGVRRVLTTAAGARRLAQPAQARGDDARTEPGSGLGLGERVSGLSWGDSVRVGDLTVTATPGRHGPHGTPRIHEVAGFLIEPAAADQPVVWISGDTVLFPALRETLAALRARPRPVDVAVLHCGGVRFPRLPVLGDRLFTFDTAQAVEVAQLLQPRHIVPIHRDGWTHFRDPADHLRDGFARSALADRVRFLGLGQSLSLP